MKCQFSTHMVHVSVSPTDGIGPTQGQRKTLTRVGIEPTTFVFITAALPTELQGQTGIGRGGYRVLDWAVGRIWIRLTRVEEIDLEVILVTS